MNQHLQIMYIHFLWNGKNNENEQVLKEMQTNMYAL